VKEKVDEGMALVEVEEGWVISDDIIVHLSEGNVSSSGKRDLAG
jgi:hypothetical protein